MINRPKAKTDRIALFQSVSRKGCPLMMCARAAIAPSCSGFTIGQICGMLHNRSNLRNDVRCPTFKCVSGRPRDRTVGYIGTRNDWGEVIDFNEGIC